MAALAVLAAIAVPSLIAVVRHAQAGADGANIKVLNNVTADYRAMRDITSGDTFAGLSTDEARIQALIDAELLSEAPKPQQKDASYKWSTDDQLWVLYVAGEAAPLTALGSTFTEISSGMIQLAQNHYDTTGSYGRSWGDYAYTDLGLNPGDWTNAVGHVIYKPGGTRLMICPEEGYTFTVEALSGDTRWLPASYHWNLVYDYASSVWYYHRIEEGSGVDISTLQIIPS